MGASAISVLLLTLSFTLMLLVDWMQGKRGGAHVAR
jgi:ABC-type sulfate transport system permease component